MIELLPTGLLYTNKQKYNKHNMDAQKYKFYRPLHMTSKQLSWKTPSKDNTFNTTEQIINETSTVYNHKCFYFIFCVYKLQNFHRLFALLNGRTLKLFPKMPVLTSCAMGVCFHVEPNAVSQQLQFRTTVPKVGVAKNIQRGANRAREKRIL